MNTGVRAGIQVGGALHNSFDTEVYDEDHRSDHRHARHLADHVVRQTTRRTGVILLLQTEGGLMERMFQILFGTWTRTRTTLIITSLLLIVAYPAFLGWVTMRVLTAMLGAVMPFAPLILMVAIIMMVLRRMIGSLFGGGHGRRRR